MAKGGGGKGGGGGGGVESKQGRQAFASAASGVLSQISKAQRGLRSSSRAYQRLERARDVVAGGRADVLYGRPKSDRAARAQQVINAVGSKGLGPAVTFGKFW